jgi:Mor family transcriptional regulator
VEEDKFVRGFLEGKSVIEMAKESGLTREGIYIHLRKLPNWKQVSKRSKAIKEAQRLESLTDTVELLKQLIDGGLSASDSARKIGMSHLTARKLLAGTKYDTTQPAKDRRDREIIKRYKKGETQVQLGKEFGLGQTAISRIIVKYNAQLPKGFRAGRKSTKKNT